MVIDASVVLDEVARRGNDHQLDGDLLLDQDEEWCEVLVDGRRDLIRFHDYHRIYDIPGMYERLFYDMLECVSPAWCSTCSPRHWPADHAMTAENLRVLDVGAGNGMVGEEIRTLGVETVHGIDILPEAAAATRRDRPDVYDDYLVADLTDLSPEQHDVLRGDDDPSGFSRLIQRVLAENTIVPLAEKHYRYRLSGRGKPLGYIAFVARKTGDVPAAWVR